MSKALERCIYNQLIVHVSNQLHCLQFGFPRGKSTTSQLLRVINEINKALENRNQVDTIYLLPPPQALLVESSNRCGRKFRDAQAVLTLAGKARKRLLNNAVKMARRL